jgi:hypothetical protein
MSCKTSAASLWSSEYLIRRWKSLLSEIADNDDQDNHYTPSELAIVCFISVETEVEVYEQTNFVPLYHYYGMIASVSPKVVSGVPYLRCEKALGAWVRTILSKS